MRISLQTVSTVRGSKCHVTRNIARALMLAISMPLVLIFSIEVLASPLKLVYPRTPITIPIDDKGNKYTYPGTHVPSVPYKVKEDPWVVNLQPDPPKFLAAASDELKKLMKNDFPNWAVSDAKNQLSDDSLNVHTYAAIHGNKGDTFCEKGACVGADFLVIYTPHKDDPTDVHWIQVLTAHGITFLDDTINKGLDPYYDDHGAANKQFFADSPRDTDDEAHTWTADLFLVTGPDFDKDHKITAGPVTVLGGIEWGWENHCTKEKKGPDFPGDTCDCACASPTPEPGSFLLFGSGAVGFCGLFGKRLLFRT